MTRTRRSPGRDSRAPSQTSAAVEASVPRCGDVERAYEAGFLAGWADRAEYARRTSLTFDDGFELGYAAGLDAANRAINDTIAEVTAGMPHDAAEVVRQLVGTWPDE